MPPELFTLTKAVGAYVDTRAFANRICTSYAHSMGKICKAAVALDNEARLGADRGDD